MARRKLNLDWVTAFWAQGAIQIPPLGQVDLSLVNDVDLDEKDGRLTVLRIVGDVLCFFIADARIDAGLGGSTSSIFYHERMYVTRENDLDGGTPHSIGDTDNAEYPFMWHRTNALHVDPVPVPDGQTSVFITADNYRQGHPHYHRIDCPVKRRLGDQDRLFYSIQNTSSTRSMFVAPFLRALVKSA